MYSVQCFPVSFPWLLNCTVGGWNDDPSGTDWARLNRSFRKNAGRWSQTKPGPRLVILRNVMKPTAHMVNHALFLSGASFDREQDLKAAQGRARSYRILEAAAMDDLNVFYNELDEQFRQAARGLPRHGMTSTLAKLHFRMLSRAGCGMHMLLRHPRAQQPFALYNMLRPDYQAMQYETMRNQSCLHDEFAAEFFHQFPVWNETSEAVLRSIAHGVSLDIAQLETRHAISRRIVTLKSLQTWCSKLETVSADWCHRQSSRHERTVHGTAKQDVQTLMDQARGSLLGQDSCSCLIGVFFCDCGCVKMINLSIINHHHNEFQHSPIF